MEPAPPAIVAVPSYRWLSRRLFSFALLFAVAPLLLLGATVTWHFASASRQRTLEDLADRLARHRREIELFLADRTARLRLLLDTHETERLRRPDVLAAAFAAINRGGRSIADLGLIDDTGRHLAYVGPYDLLDRNYAGADWFREVLRRGVHTSDMFLGFRNEPHFVIAVAGEEAGRRYILRATIDTAVFRALVEDVAVGTTGEVFLLDREGVYQTSPRLRGEIMRPSGLVLPPPEAPPAVEVVPAAGEAPERVLARTWLTEPRWLLAIRQDADEAFAAGDRVRSAALAVTIAATLLIALVSALTIRRLLALVGRRDREAEGMTLKLVESGKLASLGELSAGVAHEINNPLAILLSEGELLIDALDGGRVREPGFEGELRSALERMRTQVRRARDITGKLLRFARRTRPAEEVVDPNRFLSEAADLLRRSAETGGIGLVVDLDPNVPPLDLDPSELQQVVLNLLTNAMDALEGRPRGTITIGTALAAEDGAVEIRVVDDGPGIPEELLPRIFDPFFTTKAAGRGTGLGLAVTRSIVTRLGGTIEVVSRRGAGTRFTIRLPAGVRTKEAIP